MKRSLKCRWKASDGNNLFHAPLVGNGPGAMAFNQIPYFTLSTAKLRVIVKTPDLAIAEDTINPEPVEA